MADMAVFIRLQQVVAAMQVAAVAEDWDRFVLLQQDYQQVSAALPPLGSADFSAAERSQFAEILQKTQTALNETLPLAEAWKAYLAGELAGIHNSDKLNRTYQP